MVGRLYYHFGSNNLLSTLSTPLIFLSLLTPDRRVKDTLTRNWRSSNTLKYCFGSTSTLCLKFSNILNENYYKRTNRTCKIVLSLTKTDLRSRPKVLDFPFSHGHGDPLPFLGRPTSSRWLFWVRNTTRLSKVFPSKTFRPFRRS